MGVVSAECSKISESVIVKELSLMNDGNCFIILMHVVNCITCHGFLFDLAARKFKGKCVTLYWMEFVCWLRSWLHFFISLPLLILLFYFVYLSYPYLIHVFYCIISFSFSTILITSLEEGGRNTWRNKTKSVCVRACVYVCVRYIYQNTPKI